MRAQRAAIALHQDVEISRRHELLVLGGRTASA
jgi:hypothetical protein